MTACSLPPPVLVTSLIILLFLSFLSFLALPPFHCRYHYFKKAPRKHARPMSASSPMAGAIPDLRPSLNTSESTRLVTGKEKEKKKSVAV